MHVQQAPWAWIAASLLLTAPLRAETPSASQAPAGVDSVGVVTTGANPQGAVPESGKVALQKKRIGNMRPVHAWGDIYLAGQPAPADLTLLKRAGIQTIITLRKTDELPWDEAAAVERQGMQFVQVPFQKADELKPQVFADVLKVLRSKERGPTVLHCGVANRVGAIWYAYRILDGKISADAARKEAEIVGLKTPAYLERAQSYVEAVQSQRLQEKHPASPGNRPPN